MELPQVLSPADLEHLDTHGFVVGRGVISPEQAARTAADVWEFAGRKEHQCLDFYLDPENEDNWYNGQGRCGFKKAVELYHSQAMWDNKTCENMHGIFAQIYHTQRLRCDVGRCSITPPSRDPTEQQHVHWDIQQLYAYMEYEGGNTKENLPKGSRYTPVEAQPAPPGARSAREGVGALPPFALASVLYLTDTPSDGGAFTCIPGFHKKIDSWLGSLPASIDGKKPWCEQDLLDQGVVSVPGKAGDLVIWNSLLPHGAGVNRATKSRVVQYCGLSPAGEVSLEEIERQRHYHAHRIGSPRLGLPAEPGLPTVFRSTRARCLAALEPWPTSLAPPPSYEQLPGSASYCRAVASL
eukprot:COSAG05_NODE_3862_length_1801_cov_2.689777_1_plen_353_part_00